MSNSFGGKGIYEHICKTNTSLTIYILYSRCHMYAYVFIMYTGWTVKKKAIASGPQYKTNVAWFS